VNLSILVRWAGIVLLGGAAGEGVYSSRDEGGAHAISVSDGRQAKDMRSEQLLEGLGLGFTQLRKLLRHMCNRTMVLANLHGR
jgi:hypothetical protein